MHEVDRVKACTTSDPLDVLPMRLHYGLAVMCKNRNRKKTKPGTRDWKPNRIEPNLKNPNQPSPRPSVNYLTIMTAIPSGLQLQSKFTK